MSDRNRIVCLGFLMAALLAVAALPRPAHAGVSEAALALAPALAQQFGVPASAVTGLLERGISVESVTQLLLVSQSSKTDLDQVAEVYRDQGNDIAHTAAKLDVDPSAYSKERVTAAIDQAKSSAQAEATQKATDEANKAIGDALGGLAR